jgi:hypothetical protein
LSACIGRLQVREIHQRQIVTVPLVTTNPFIVVQKIATAIENETIAMDFDGSRMMRRMSVNDGYPCSVDERSSESLLLIYNMISPVGSPMN